VINSKLGWAVLLVILGGASIYTLTQKKIVDSALSEGKTVADFPQTASAWFDAMDNGVTLNDEQRKGRNTWLLWSGGNQDFWDYMAGHSFGTVDLLKIMDSRNRRDRFKWFGIINDPDMQQAKSADQYGLWLDTPKDKLASDVDEKVYGKPSGIVGLRLYPNPDFDEKAKAKWDGARYYQDQGYYYSSKLVRPYRVGMTCAFCHVSFHPLNAPTNTAEPDWKNLSNNIGAQYLWINRVFGYDLKPDNFIWQLFRTSPPGALDTSFIATDNINNPRTMNAIYSVAARLATGHKEKQAGGNLDLPNQQTEMVVPHILKDGADSVGIYGALSRVYVNIGQFHQQWIKNHNPILGGLPQSPFEIKNAMHNSVYWQSTAERVGPLADFFIQAAQPTALLSTPEGVRYLSQDKNVLHRGKEAFAQQCASCHSSKQPTAVRGSEQYKTQLSAIVMSHDFLKDNYLSTDARIPITKLQTNACSALATNSTRNHVWDNFSSETYKTLPSVGEIVMEHPVTGKPFKFKAPSGGPGYQRVPSLISAWASAPFLHNNALGSYHQDPSIAGRLVDYEDAMQKLLWPEKRDGFGSIYRTTEESWIKIHPTFIPAVLSPFLKELEDDTGNIAIGPIPKGTPVNLLANINFSLEDKDQLKKTLKVLIKVKKALILIHQKNLKGDDATAVLLPLIDPLISISKCPDFITDKGHYYGTKLSDEDKKALIEYVKYL
jgi:hypothetical protein